MGKPNSNKTPPPPLTAEEKAHRLNLIILTARAQERTQDRERSEMVAAKRAMVGR